MDNLAKYAAHGTAVGLVSLLLSYVRFGKLRYKQAILLALVSAGVFILMDKLYPMPDKKTPEKSSDMMMKKPEGFSMVSKGGVQAEGIRPEFVPGAYDSYDAAHPMMSLR